MLGVVLRVIYIISSCFLWGVVPKPFVDLEEAVDNLPVSKKTTMKINVPKLPLKT